MKHDPKESKADKRFDWFYRPGVHATHFLLVAIFVGVFFVEQSKIKAYESKANVLNLAIDEAVAFQLESLDQAFLDDVASNSTFSGSTADMPEGAHAHRSGSRGRTPPTVLRSTVEVWNIRLHVPDPASDFTKNFEPVVKVNVVVRFHRTAFDDGEVEIESAGGPEDEAFINALRNAIE